MPGRRPQAFVGRISRYAAIRQKKPQCIAGWRSRLSGLRNRFQALVGRIRRYAAIRQKKPQCIAGWRSRLSGLRNRFQALVGRIRRCAAIRQKKHLQLQNIFHKRDGELALGGDRSAIQLIEGVEQRAHLAIQPFQQKTADIFRQLKAANARA